MSIRVALTHRTTYRYDHPVALGPQLIRLRPAPHVRTPILSYALQVEPEPHFLNWQQDPQGNFLARVVFPERVTRFEVTVDLVADMATINPFDFFLEPEAESFPFTYAADLAHDLAPYLAAAPAGARLAALLAEVPRVPRRSVDFLVDLNQRVQRRVGYIVRLEPGVLTPEETLGRGKGSCRDSAWLLVQALRHLGIAARFVSGYLIQLAPDQAPLEGPPGPEADFTDLHAWAEAYLPGAGWVGLDATSGLMAGEGHIPLAATADPQGAAPITGGVERAEVEFGFEMTVRRIHQTPRSTKPYDENIWDAIRATGDEVDTLLAARDVRLTMGGEPTFIAASDFEAPEWNGEALGPTKRRFAGRLLRRLGRLWAPGAALCYGQGKQYPGEPLPRWALHAYWRRDGVAAWHEPDLLADPDQGAGTADEGAAARFLAALAARLRIDPALAVQAYEDIHYHLWREHRLPANVTAEASKLRDPLERARLARLFGRGLDRPAGSVLPLRRVLRQGVRHWQGGRWFFRDSTLFLIPGDSPLGLRLPLDSLPWIDPAAIEADEVPDPFAPPAMLPQQALHTGADALAAPFAPLAQTLAGDEDRSDLVRTALAVEVRDGHLHVFLPPLPGAEDWLALIAAIEATAAEQAMPVVLEGYQPPFHRDLHRFSVTPDPGVIGGNAHPAPTCSVLLGLRADLYAAARQDGLAAEKFMLDGRHVGTGGGNHVVMGAATPPDSPFLRRPDLLKSLVGFWHNHPSLSFLFSGLFIGPTSQHPRLDEARDDAVGQLEIAFAQIDPAHPLPPWLADRVFRNLLADMTGNTHRTEFCIDKMYDPAGPTGRLGLVEFRAFEMPPHPRMAAAQALLMRAAVAAFWAQPYMRRPVRWGTRLHDDFLLPHFCAADLEEALAELSALGPRLDPAWFEPHLAFRFPLIGEVERGGIALELRHALEPWHVLAEDASPAGTVRFVDSSLERVQLRVQGWAAERFALVCNGIAVPLTPTERAGEWVGGVRFKAWAPPNALHPTIGVHEPLVFDIHDGLSGRSIGGMTYHVSHPGGRSYDTFPINANEAEARRRARFLPFGHTPGVMAPPRAVQGLEHPRLLDLRRFA